jgi:hypothetical protein
MATEPNPRIQRALLEIIQNQLQADNPAETRLTLERLLKKGISRKRALKLISCIVLSEIYDVLDSNLPFDEARYVAALRALPHLPWETMPNDPS